MAKLLRYAPGMDLSAGDLELAVEVGASGWTDLAGGHVLLTGGTGFFGVWLLAALHAADRRHGLELRVDVLSRDPARFLARFPALGAWPALSWITGDVRTFRAPHAYTHVIAGATAASAALNQDHPLEMFDVIVSGTRATLDQLRGSPRVLMVSSGAVYGRQPPELDHLPEDFRGAHDPLDPAAAYGIGKLAAEHLAVAWGRSRGAPVVVARPFAFVGPHLPMDAHFAIGNFVADALAGRPITVKGDGTPFRSYLYAAELAAWLWVLVARGVGGRAYNVGSEEAVSIAELAHLVSREAGVPWRVEGVPRPGVPAARYVPRVARIAEELGLQPRVDLAEGVRRMLAWARGREDTRGVGG